MAATGVIDDRTLLVLIGELGFCESTLSISEEADEDENEEELSLADLVFLSFSAVDVDVLVPPLDFLEAFFLFFMHSK